MPTLSQLRPATPAALVLALATFGAAMLSSCYTSPDPAAIPIDRSPRGIEAKFRFSDRSHGMTELLAVTDTGLVVLRGARVLFVRYERIRFFRFETVGSAPWGGATFDPKMRDRLRYLSRFPFGMSDAVLAELLRGAGQQAPDTIAAKRR